MSANRLCTTLMSVTTVSTWRRACRSPRLAKVIRRSASGRSLRALASVVVILPCSNSAVARLAIMWRWWAGLPPSRWPLVGVGIEGSPGSAHSQVRCVVRRYLSAAFRRRSVLLGLDVVVLVVRPVAVGRGAGVEARRGVLQREAHVVELLLDFLNRLRAEVADVQQILLAAGDELTHGVDALALEAVVGPDGKVQVLDRQRQVLRQRGVARRRADVDTLGLQVQLPGQAEQLNQRLSGAGHRVLRTQARLGLDVQDQPVEVGPLLDSGRLDLVGDPQYG